MILIDGRGGAKSKDDINHYPTRLQSMIPNSMLTRLESGDVAFSGANGITVGIELKRISDAISCLFSSRLADTQLPAMAQAYDVRYLIVEELYRAEPGTGVLQRWRAFPSSKDTICGCWYDARAGRNKTMYSTFELWLHTMSEQGQARLERTADTEATASLITVLYNWWQREDHKSFNVMYENTGDAAVLSRPTMLRRMANLLPGIGWTRSKAVADYFGSVNRMVNASEADWLNVDGIGKGIAKKVMEAMR